MTARNEATERQIQAARPDTSTWLAANAGSGKTRVLTDRVARLLLDGVEPQHILCLTYTKAAASEMQNRLFERLGKWAMLPDDRLIVDLRELGSESDLNAQFLANARTLFARALETPGGLKIQTIHSFCAALLRRFPLEARISPQFSEMEDRAATLLRADIVEDFADGPQANLITMVAKFITDSDFSKLTRAITQNRTAFANPLSRETLLDLFGLPPNAGPGLPITIAFDGSEAALIAEAVPILRQQSSTMVKLSDALASIDWKAPDMDALNRCYAVFLFSKSGTYLAGAKTKSVPTKNAGKAFGPLLEPFHGFMNRIAQARESEFAMAAVAKSQILHRFAAAFLPEYERRKQQRGWLDFDDLIHKARQLLNDPGVAAWVLYRLDGGIDHILVDEAQDTSPAQWDVIEKLAQEFTSGVGARGDKERTIFVVGDKKQSIYSFQGADPQAFDQMQAEFSGRLDGRLENLTLDYSFRSSQIILRLVDLVFDGQSEAGFGDGQHIAFKSDLPGRVDLWPVVEKVDDRDDRVWTDPVDRPGALHHTVILAQNIAAGIKRMIDDQETIPIDGPEKGKVLRRPVKAGDFLILVQRRSDLFAEIIRACKNADLPIAGADRLKVGAELAVKDLAALLNFLATPEDCLALAIVLKSPLLGWDEQALFDLAHRREVPFLWQALRARADEFPETMTLLNDLRGQTDFLRPYDLIERILTRHDGRRNLLGRLGMEAEDGINALLSQALAYERAEVPSLTGFLVWMQTDDLEIKRQVGSAGNLVRVMTVHGAKGLESPIVILPDTGPRRAPNPDEIMLADGKPLWRTTADMMPGTLIKARDATRAKQMNERMRLLYVALTRAEKWLIIAAAGDLDKGGDSWYQYVEAVMISENAVLTNEGGQAISRLDHGDWYAPKLQVMPDADQPKPDLPELFSIPAPPSNEIPQVFNPSDLGGAKALGSDHGLDEGAAKMRGTHVHLLLELLPLLEPAEWPAAALNILSNIKQDQRAEILGEVSKVLTDPELADVFVAGSLSEVPITAHLGDRKMYGVVDRLLVSDDHVLAIDFKTNATVPRHPTDCPDGLLRQMGAYATALTQVYPDRRVEVAILWTKEARLMPLPYDLVIGALERSSHLDVNARRS
ncbi:MAG: double-strand break repair helicase AddA [Rhodobacteraceae bacterium]|nr:double-strand break repair helicase AddA [Paracoccaceae bacterium]